MSAASTSSTPGFNTCGGRCVFGRFWGGVFCRLPTACHDDMCVRNSPTPVQAPPNEATECPCTTFTKGHQPSQRTGPHPPISLSLSLSLTHPHTLMTTSLPLLLSTAACTCGHTPNNTTPDDPGLTGRSTRKPGTPAACTVAHT